MELIEDYAKKMKKGPKDAPKAVAKLVGKFHKGRAAAALKGLEALIAEPGKRDADKVRMFATQWRDQLTAQLDRTLQRIGWMVENGYYSQASELLAELTKAVKGHDD